MPSPSGQEARDRLVEANRVRIKRAALTAQFKKNPQLAIDLLNDVPEWLEAEKIGTLLRRFPRIKHHRVRTELLHGATKVEGFDTEIPFSISETRRVGDLSKRERDHIVSVLQRKIEKKRRGRGETPPPKPKPEKPPTAVERECGQILAWLNGTPVRRGEIQAEATPGLTGRQVKWRLEVLAREGKVVQTADGWWQKVSQ